MMDAARLLSILVLGASAALALDLGGPAPPLTGVDWVAEPPAVAGGASVVLVSGDADEALARAKLLRQAAMPLPLTCVVFAGGGDTAALRLRLAVAKPAFPIGLAGDAAQEWLPGWDEAELSVLLTADGVVAWIGPDLDLVAAQQELAAGTLDLARLVRIHAARSTARAAMAREAVDEAGRQAALAEAAKAAAVWLIEDPVDHEAITLALAAAREQGDVAAHRAILAALPLALVDADLASSLAFDQATDQELPWRHLDQALRLARHAQELDGDHVGAVLALARIHDALGLPEEAMRFQLRAASLAPDDPDIQADLSYYREVLTLRSTIGVP